MEAGAKLNTSAATGVATTTGWASGRGFGGGGAENPDSMAARAGGLGAGAALAGGGSRRGMAMRAGGTLPQGLGRAKGLGGDCGGGTRYSGVAMRTRPPEPRLTSRRLGPFCGAAP